AAFSVVIRPASRSRRAVALVSETVFVHGLEEEELGVLVVGHIVLLVGDDEVVDALSYGVIGIGYLHFESSDGRMPGVGRAQNVTEVGVGEANVSGIVQEKRGATRLDELTHSLALLGLDPKLRPRSFLLRHGRIENQLRPAGGHPGGVGAFIAAVA